MIRAATLLLAALPAGALAAGGSPTPPAPTQTTTECPEGTVWDAERAACVRVESNALTDAQRHEAARELAHHGRPGDALALMATVAAPDADMLATMGFATRQVGDWEGATALYAAALEIAPGHWQTLSYWGQGHVERGEIEAAREKLSTIRATGGRGTWAEWSLADALRTGRGYAY